LQTDHVVEEGFADEKHRSLFVISDHPGELVDEMIKKTKNS
jgi:predicted Rossmann-fold nucleotide-binding protein